MISLGPWVIKTCEFQVVCLSFDPLPWHIATGSSSVWRRFMRTPSKCFDTIPTKLNSLLWDSSSRIQSIIDSLGLHLDYDGTSFKCTRAKDNPPLPYTSIPPALTAPTPYPLPHIINLSWVNARTPLPHQFHEPQGISNSSMCYPHICHWFVFSWGSWCLDELIRNQNCTQAVWWNSALTDSSHTRVGWTRRDSQQSERVLMWFS